MIEVLSKEEVAALSKGFCCIHHAERRLRKLAKSHEALREQVVVLEEVIRTIENSPQWIYDDSI